MSLNLEWYYENGDKEMNHKIYSKKDVDLAVKKLNKEINFLYYKAIKENDDESETAFGVCLDLIKEVFG